MCLVTNWLYDRKKKTNNNRWKAHSGMKNYDKKAFE